MNWFQPLDLYCERASPAFWAEPVNAVSNGAFLVAAAAAFALWRRAGGRDGPALALVVVIAIVGVGSFLFHTHANAWSLLADVLPITAFIYGYFLLAMRRFLGLAVLPALLVTGAFLGFNLAFEDLWRQALGPDAPTLNGSLGYLPAAGALVAVAAALLARWRPVRADLDRLAAGSLLAAAGAFALSLAFRSVDQAACAVLPVGTHFLWHALNAVVLYFLVHGAIRHRAASSGPRSA